MGLVCCLEVYSVNFNSEAGIYPVILAARRQTVKASLFTMLIPFCCLAVTACATSPRAKEPATQAMSSVRLANGQSLAYRYLQAENHADRSVTKLPVIFIHGIPDASDSWLRIMARVSADHPVYAVDLAGYGYSNWPDDHDFSLSAQADYLYEFMNKLQLGAVILVGHDIGGGITQIITSRHPDRVARMVLIDSVIGANWPVWEMRLLRTPVIGAAGFALMDGLIWQYMLHKGFYNDRLLDESTVSRYTHWWLGAEGRNRLIRNARALDNRDLTNLQPPVAQLTTPTLILWGAQDRFLDRQPAQALCTAMSNCQFALIEQAGHFLLDEQPGSVSARIIDFLH